MSQNLKQLICLILVGLLFTAVPPCHGTVITDRSGQRLTVNKPFVRIISLYSAHTENLFSLGLSDEIVGVSVTDDYPDEVNSKTRFSYREDPEKFLAARPDLVIVRPMIERAYPNLIARLRQSGITVVSLQPTNAEEMFAYWQKLGILTGRGKQAAKMVQSFQEEISRILSITAAISMESRKKVYFEAIHRKMKTFAASSMAMHALQVAGGINVAKDAIQVRNTNIAAYGKERILSHADEIDVYLAQVGAMNKVDAGVIRSEPGFSVIKAVAQGQVFLIDEKIVSRPTLRQLEGIRQIAGLLYPQYFKNGQVNK